MTTYLITLEEPTGAIISQEAIDNDISPIDALREYAADHGWKPEQEELEEAQNMEYWYMIESDGTRIVVEIMEED